MTSQSWDLISLKNVTDNEDLMVINKSGITIRIGVDTLRVMGRATQGVKLIRLRDEDSIASVAKVSKFESEEIDEIIGDDENSVDDSSSNDVIENENQDKQDISEPEVLEESVDNEEPSDEIDDSKNNKNNDNEPPNLFSDF